MRKPQIDTAKVWEEVFDPCEPIAFQEGFRFYFTTKSGKHIVAKYTMSQFTQKREDVMEWMKSGNGWRVSAEDRNHRDPKRHWRWAKIHLKDCERKLIIDKCIKIMKEKMTCGQ